MDAQGLFDAIVRIRKYAWSAKTDHDARLSAYLIASKAIRDAGSDTHGIPVLGRVDGAGRVTFFKD